MKIIMDSGKEYVFEGEMWQLQKKVVNGIGVLCNCLLDLGNGIIINPSHISSLEVG